MYNRQPHYMIFNDTDYKNYGNTPTCLMTAFPAELIPRPVNIIYLCLDIRRCTGRFLNS